MAKTDFLQEIVEHKRGVVAQKRVYFDSLKKNIGKDRFTRYGLFKRQISRPGTVNLIAEIKKASPSKGMLREDFDPLAIARVYADAGAAAISVLTEEKYFLGRPEYIKRLSEQIKLPYLAKDFFIDEGQIYEAALNGASAILLIVAILSDDQIKNLMGTAHGLDVDCLVEVHDEQELERALNAGAEIIGINNRSLRTFEVDTRTAHRLLVMTPPGKVTVAESGIQTHDDILALQQAGAHAVLIGETFMKEKDITKKVREVMHGQS